MVKTRRGDAYGTAAAAVTPAKQARLRRLAAAYLSSVDQGPCRVRFDVVTVTWPSGATGPHGPEAPRGVSGPSSACPTVEHLEGVF
jgi:Holliday junction resolvase-like predicted endonuclease